MTAPEGSLTVPRTVPPTTWARSRPAEVRPRTSARIASSLRRAGGVRTRFVFMEASRISPDPLFDAIVDWVNDHRPKPTLTNFDLHVKEWSRSRSNLLELMRNATRHDHHIPGLQLISGGTPDRFASEFARRRKSPCRWSRRKYPCPRCESRPRSECRAGWLELGNARRL